MAPKSKRGAKSSAERVYTPAEVQDFNAGLKVLRDWDDNELQEKYVKLIQWYDRENIRGGDLRQRWTTEGYRAKDGILISYTALHKAYTERAPGFYARKGLVWVPLNKRQQPRVGTEATTVRSKAAKHGLAAGPTDMLEVPHAHGRKGDGSKKRTVALDVKLRHQFSKIVTPLTVSVNFGANWKTGPGSIPSPEELEVSQDDINRYHANRQSGHTLSFKRKGGDVVHGHPAQPVLQQDCAVKYCKFLRDALEADPRTNTVAYGEDIDETAIRRFIACLSPSVRSSLPTHDLVKITNEGRMELKAIQIPWTMQDFQDVYIVAHAMGAELVCDMIIDRWHEELHRPTGRLLHTELGDVETFDILGIEPAFLNTLAERDDKGFDFLIELIIMNGPDGWKLLTDYGLDNWNDKVKQVLFEKMKREDVLTVSTKDPQAVCQKFHHHHEQDGECYRLQADAVPSTPEPTTTHSAPTIKDQESRKRKHDRGDDSLDLDSNGPIRKRIKASSRITLKHRRYYRSDSEDSDEDSSAITISLSHEYNGARLHLTSSNEDDADEDIILYDNTAVLEKVDRIVYQGKGMNGTKDSAEIARKKMDLVKKQLELFRGHGYSLGDLDVDMSEEESDFDEDEE